QARPPFATIPDDAHRGPPDRPRAAHGAGGRERDPVGRFDRCAALRRGTRARPRFFHALISDTFDSELALQKQALALNVQLAPGYRAIVLTLLQGKTQAERGAEMLLEATTSVELPARALTHVADPTTLLVLWPEGGPRAEGLVAQLQAECELRWTGRAKPVVRAGL